MKVWIDLSNAPHAQLFKSLIKDLRKEHEVLVTARKYGFLEDLCELYNLQARIIGAHAGRCLPEKLEASTTRVKELTALVKKEKPDVLVCKYSIEGMRVAYGLGIKSIFLLDNEHGFAMNNLCAPLATNIVIPEVLKETFQEQFGNRDMTTFKGIFETAHLRGFNPDKSVLDKLGANGHNILTVRTGPLEAHYFNNNGSSLGNFVKDLDYEVFAFTRNCVDTTALEKANVHLLKNGIDTLSLEYYSDVFLGEGGTMNRESAVLGTPTISCYPDELLAVDKLLIDKGLMQHSLDKEEIKGMISRADKAKSREKATKVLKEFENPLEKVRGLLGV